MEVKINVQTLGKAKRPVELVNEHVDLDKIRWDELPCNGSIFIKCGTGTVALIATPGSAPQGILRGGVGSGIYLALLFGI